MTTTLAPDRSVPDTGRRDRHLPTAARILLVAVAVLLPAVAGAYPVTVAATALVFAVLAISTQLLVGVAGLPTLAQPAYLGIGAYTAALLARAGADLGVLQLAAAVLTAGLAAALTGIALLRTRGTPFLMASFAVQAITAVAASRWTSLTGGDDGLHTPPVRLWPGTAPLTGPAFLYWYVLAGTIVAGTVIAVVLRSRLGLVLRGIAGHEPRMVALGHPVTAELAAGYTIAGAVAGLGGALLVAAHQYISPADLGFETAALALLAAAIGAGTMTGAALGAILIIAVRDGLGVSTGGAGPLLLGLLFLAVAYLRPALARLSRALHQRRR